MKNALTVVQLLCAAVLVWHAVLPRAAGWLTEGQLVACVIIFVALLIPQMLAYLNGSRSRYD